MKMHYRRPVLIERRPATDPELVALITAQQRELVAREIAEVRSRVSNYPLHNGIRFLGAVVDRRLVGCGAIQAMDARTAEIKHMYVRPAYRRRGIARQVLAALEELAWSAGHTTLRVATGDYMPEAVKLYTSSGYLPIPTYEEYAGNPNSVCFEKRSSDAYGSQYEPQDEVLAGHRPVLATHARSVAIGREYPQ
jgi:GNAT superfamily N-acetyltransferase